MSARHIQALVERERKAVPYAPVTIKTDAGRRVLTVLGERATEYPGVVQQPVSIRSYPFGEMAAHVLGDVGQVTEPELEEARLPGRAAGDRGGPGRSRVPLRPLPAWRTGRRAGRGQRRRLPRAEPPGPDSAQGRAQPPGDARHAPADRRPKRRCWKAWNTRARSANRRSRARSRRSTRSTAKCWRSARGPRSTPTSSPKRLTTSEYKALEGNGTTGGRLTDRAVNGRISDGLDVQADHRDGGARSGRDHAQRRPRRREVHLRLEPSSSATPAMPNTERSGSSTR